MLLRRNVPVEFVAEPCGITLKTSYEWQHRVLATVSGYRDRIVLRDTVWVDETYINGTDLSKGYGRARKRRLYRQKLRICVAVEIHKNLIVIACNHGKPSSVRVRRPMGGKIVTGSPLIQDLERAYGVLARDGGPESEARSADANGPVYLERLEMEDDLYSWLKH